MARELRSISGMARTSTGRGPEPAPLRLVDRAPGVSSTTLSRPAWSYQALLPPDLRSASFTREFVSHRLAAHDLHHLVHDVRLVASELATDAVLRAHRPVILSLCGGDRLVMLSVRGSSRSAPAQPCARALDSKARGLSIVDSVTHDWGVLHGPGGKGVWAAFEVRRDDQSRRADDARRMRLSG